MSNRLESLNSKKPSTPAKPGLKFKPKVVQRKSKEERAKVAPQVKQEQPKSLPTRGRGGARGGRGRGGRNNYAGTHLVTSGPLSAGSVAIGNPTSSKLGLTSDLIYNSNGENLSTPEFISNLKIKDKKSKSLTPGVSESDDEDDPTKINMTEQYRFEDNETELFPYRPFRDDGIQREELDKDEKPPVKIEQLDSNTNTPTPAMSLTRENTEAIEDKIELIKENKAKLESKITQNDSIITDEKSKLITDHEQIINLLTGGMKSLSTDDDEKYVLFQLPQHLPEYKRKESKVKLEKEEEEDDNTLKGEIGKVNIHQSGKITIDLGKGIRLNVTKGSSTDFLQELAVLDLNQNSNDDEDIQMVDDDGRELLGKLIRLGTVNDKIIATPCIE
ncbi:RPC53 [Candida jiufengensis]|uniref:RPC53 n=1 Tax=Candida jiufengensis TaxID=497108 RepID=UPI0022242319|nr:RPC53 [Candida jiufengensis]KAI5955153.1 RPC53 [Candida jiufengensis]